MEIVENITGTDISIRINDITTCYDDLGKSRVPIIFIHGFPFNKSTWKPQMEYFRKTHRVIAYDIRGFGKSTIGKEKLSIGLLADDLISFMDALEIKKAIVCGLSMGGYVLMKASYHYPHRFEAFILSDTQCVADTFEIKEKRHQAIVKIRTGKLKEFTESFIKDAFCNESLINKKDIVEKIRSTILSAPPLTVASMLAAIAERKEMCTGLSNIKSPSLIICGKKDKITPISASELLQSKLPHSKLEIINKAGHLANLENPEDFNQKLFGFISKEVPSENNTY